MIEYEAKFLEIDKKKVRTRLASAGAVLVRPEFVQKRVVLDLPDPEKSKQSWLRVRDEGDKITLSFKTVDGAKIENQKEVSVVVTDFDTTVSLLQAIGCKKKGYQVTKRELWKISAAEITIDEWPFLPPFVEIEASSEDEVKMLAEKLGFDYSKAVFGASDVVYSMRYGVPPKALDAFPELTFEMKNPFLS